MVNSKLTLLKKYPTDYFTVTKIACSSDGSKVYYMEKDEEYNRKYNIYFSGNFGNIFIKKKTISINDNYNDSYVFLISCSSDGSKAMFTISYYYYVNYSELHEISEYYYSNDFGDTWVKKITLEGFYPYNIYFVPEGNTIIIGGNDRNSNNNIHNSMYISKDNGNTWTIKTFEYDIDAIDSSLDGKKIVAIPALYEQNKNNFIYASNDFGDTWVKKIVEGETFQPYRITCSADGNTIFFGTWFNGNIYISNDFGTTWKKILLPNYSCFTFFCSMSNENKNILLDIIIYSNENEVEDSSGLVIYSNNLEKINIFVDDNFNLYSIYTIVSSNNLKYIYVEILHWYNPDGYDSEIYDNEISNCEIYRVDLSFLLNSTLVKWK